MATEVEQEHKLSARYANMLGKLGFDPLAVPLNFAPRHDGGVHVEPLAGGGWRYCITERGQTTESRDYVDDDDLLFRMACGLVGEAGAKRQGALPRAGADPRRADFAHRLELMGRISPAWRQRLAGELAMILARHPYRDRPVPVLPDSPPSPSRRAIMVFLVAIAALFLAALHWPLWEAFAEQQRLANAAQTVGLITARHMVDGRFSDAYRLDYDFTAGGQRIEASAQVDWQTFRAAEPAGSRVIVQYDHANPRRHMVRGNDTAGRLLRIYAAIDALLAFLILRGWWRARREGAAD